MKSNIQNLPNFSNTIEVVAASTISLYMRDKPGSILDAQNFQDVLSQSIAIIAVRR